MDVESDGEKDHWEFPVSVKKLYHSSAVSLMPAMKGLMPMAKYTLAVFDPEKKGVKRSRAGSP